MFFQFYVYTVSPHLNLHSFPTRRSSDLRTALSYAVGEWARVWPLQALIRSTGAYFVRRSSGDPLYRRSCGARSEEHTSELQSRSDLVCRLLLEKKKYKNII